MKSISLAQIAQWCDGELSENSEPQLMINLVVIDSRKVICNSLLVAVKGDNYDAHDFVVNALNNQIGSAALVSCSSGLNMANLIYVPDTILALGKIASNYRQQFKDIKITAITGSHGKTTVKEMLKLICVEEFGDNSVLATDGNLNNHLGVPLMLLRIEPQHKIAIIEMGMNHSGEINYLTNLTKPHIACVTNVHMAHAGFFKSLNDIALAKGEIFSGLQANGIACINAEFMDIAKSWYEFLHTRPDINIYNYGATKDNKISSKCFISYREDNGNMTISLNNNDILIKLNVIGQHNQDNALCSTVVAYNLGCNNLSIANGLNKYNGYKRRLEKKIAFNGALLIDDSYNAGPASVMAAINAISNLPRPHWLVFADLKELGEFTIKTHEDMADFMNKMQIDMLLSIGDIARITYNKFSGNKLHFNTNQDIINYCISNLPQHATLLLKGSNSMNLDEIVNKLIF